MTSDQLRARERCKRLGHLPCPALACPQMAGGGVYCDRCGAKLR